MKNALTTNAMAVKTARELLNAEHLSFKQFRSCNAYVSEIPTERATSYRFIKSYDTVVAIVDYDAGTFTEFGKYSVTTSKQVTQIYNSMFFYLSREFNPARI